MKNRIKIFFTIIVVVIFLIMVWYIIHPRNVSNNTNKITPTPPSTANTKMEPTIDPLALKNILHTGKKQKCSVTDANGITETYYMNSDVVRGDITLTQHSPIIHLLAGGGVVYTWIDSQTKGNSISEYDIAAINTNMRALGASGFDISAKKDTNCTQWKPDMSILAAPNSVVFTPVAH